MNYQWMLLDLDETVYPTSNGLWEEIGNRINLYLLKKMHFPPDEIPEIRTRLYREYGTTLRGLMALYEINQEDYLNFVHDIPLEQFLQPSPDLKEMFSQYPLSKFIFTNADKNHAVRVLQKLEILECFDGIIDIFDIAPFCKPQIEAYHIAMDIAGVIHPEKCVMVDDRIINLESARQVNISTVMVGDRNIEQNTHVRINRLADLPLVIPYNTTGKYDG